MGTSLVTVVVQRTDCTAADCVHCGDAEHDGDGWDTADDGEHVVAAAVDTVAVADVHVAERHKGDGGNLGLGLEVVAGILAAAADVLDGGGNGAATVAAALAASPQLLWLWPWPPPPGGGNWSTCAPFPRRHRT